MSQRTYEPASQQRSRSMLDRAIIASVIAMVAMNVVVLAQQLQAAPILLSAGNVAGASLA